MVGDGWTEVMWVNTQPPTATDDEWKELERKDFETMEALRRRVDTIIHDPEVAAKLKPYYGKNCKRVCFHDEYLQSFNLPNVHLVDTDGKGVDEITPTGVVVGGTEYPVDCLVLASGFEVNTDLDQRLGFDPVGRDGIALSKRWSDGPHTLHGILSGGFPNLLIISLVQAGFGTNFVHFLAKSAEHVAEIIATCRDRKIATIESMPDAEEEWLGVLYSVAGGAARYAGSCTPSYYNGEARPDEREERPQPGLCRQPPRLLEVPRGLAGRRAPQRGQGGVPRRQLTRNGLPSRPDGESTSGDVTGRTAR